MSDRYLSESMYQQISFPICFFRMIRSYLIRMNSSLDSSQTLISKWILHLVSQYFSSLTRHQTVFFTGGAYIEPKKSPLPLPGYRRVDSKVGSSGSSSSAASLAAPDILEIQGRDQNDTLQDYSSNPAATTYRGRNLSRISAARSSRIHSRLPYAYNREPSFIPDHDSSARDIKLYDYVSMSTTPNPTEVRNTTEQTVIESPSLDQRGVRAPTMFLSCLEPGCSATFILLQDFTRTSHFRSLPYTNRLICLQNILVRTLTPSSCSITLARLYTPIEIGPLIPEKFIHLETYKVFRFPERILSRKFPYCLLQESFFLARKQQERLNCIAMLERQCQMTLSGYSVVPSFLSSCHLPPEVRAHHDTRRPSCIDIGVVFGALQVCFASRRSARLSRLSNFAAFGKACPI